jgi:thioredoxin reductase
MYDNGEYRNGPTRHMHDVIGADGLDPAYFRFLARQQISAYGTATMKNGTVTSITRENDYFRVITREGDSVTARKVVLGTGMEDIVPNTPGLREAWGKGVFWCPWCDGWEHRDQPLGVIGPLQDVMGAVVEIYTLNSDIVCFTNGTDTPEQRAVLAGRYPNWEAQLAQYNVRIINEGIVSLERLQDGGQNHDPVTGEELDLFRVHLAGGATYDRSAFLTNFQSRQRSNLHEQLGLFMDGNKIGVNPGSMRGLNAQDKSQPVGGVWAVGDITNGNSTNVPHAMYSGKKAAVYIHGESPFCLGILRRQLDANREAVELAREESLASIGKRGSEATRRALEKEAFRLIGDNLEPLWKKAKRQV